MAEIRIFNKIKMFFQISSFMFIQLKPFDILF